jgi:hypothetical protein
VVVILARTALFARESIDLNFKWRIEESSAVYKIVYSDVMEKTETRLSP